FIIMGKNGAGKGTQSSLLCRAYDLVHISVGDILRWNIQNHTKIAAKIIKHIQSGQLVPDEIVFEVVKKRLEEHNWNYGFVLDGFPRNLNQAEFFMESYDIDAVIHIHVSDDVAIKRVLSRRICEHCKLDYNLIYHRPQNPDFCDVCGGRLLPRADDTPNAIREQVYEYNSKTIPIIDYFKQKEIVITVNGDKPIEQVHSEIKRELLKADVLRLSDWKNYK
ncbi:MAG: adenylate kinase family protein, partial [Limisphaerales bacterium]